MEPLQPTTCPRCLTVYRSQGFHVVVDEIQPLCDSCAKWEEDNQYLKSEAYQTWLASIPLGLSIQEVDEWMKTNPPPSKKAA